MTQVANASTETSQGTSQGTSQSSLQDTGVSRQPVISRNSALDTIGQRNTLTKSTFASEAAENSPARSDALSQSGSSSISSPDVMAQLDSLTNSNFNSQPAADSPIPSADLMATTNIQPIGSSALSSSSNGNGSAPAEFRKHGARLQFSTRAEHPCASSSHG